MWVDPVQISASVIVLAEALLPPDRAGERLGWGPLCAHAHRAHSICLRRPTSRSYTPQTIRG